MNLSVARIGKEGAPAVSAPSGGHVAAHGVGGKVEDVSISACAEENRVCGVSLHFSSHQVAGDDAFGMTVYDNDIKHLGAGVHFHTAPSDFFIQCGVGAEQELLPGLATSVKSSRHLSTAEGAVVKVATVFPGEGHALSDALVDDVDAYLGKAVDV